jgi:hypothetical protein
VSGEFREREREWYGGRLHFVWHLSRLFLERKASSSNGTNFSSLANQTDLHTRAGVLVISKRHPNQGGRSGPACRRTVLCHRNGNSNSSNSHPCLNRRRRRGSKALAKRRRVARRRKRRGHSLSRKRAIMQLRRGTLRRLRVSSLLRRRRRRLRRGVLTGEEWRLLPLLLLPCCDHQHQQRHYPLLEVAMYRRD